MGRAVTQADSNQPPPPTQQIAALTPDQMAAYQGVRNLQGATEPDFTQAQTNYRIMSNLDYNQAVQPGMQNIDFKGAVAPGIDLMQQAGNRDTTSVAYPFASQGAGYIDQSARGSALAGASPYIAASTQPTGLMAASPYLAAASAPSSTGIASYMNPYNDAVTNRIAQLGARNLSENLLPTISSDFIKAGQYGSQRQGDLIQRALRDTQESVLGQQASALQQGYGQAVNAAQSDSARLAGLASTAGGLGTAQQQALLGAGQATGQLSSSDLARLQAAGVDLGQLGLGLSSAQATDAARQLAAGQGVGNLGLGAAQAQANYGLQQGQLNLGALSGYQSALGNAAQGLQGLGTQRQNSGLQAAAALESAGAAQQGQGQANLNALYNQQVQQYNLPWDTISKLSGVIQGLPVGQTTSGTTQTTTPGPSVAGQIGGIGLGVAGLANSGIFKAKGGAVRKNRRTHSYGAMPKRGIAIAEAA